MSEPYPIYFRIEDFAQLSETINPDFNNYKDADGKLAENILRALDTVPHETCVDSRVLVCQTIFDCINMALSMTSYYITKAQFSEIVMEGQQQQFENRYRPSKITPDYKNNMPLHLSSNDLMNDRIVISDYDLASVYSYAPLLGDKDVLDKMRLHDRRVAYVDGQIYKDARVSSFVESLKDTKTLETAMEDYYAYIHVGFYHIYNYKAGGNYDEYDTLAKLVRAIAEVHDESTVVCMALHNLKVQMDDVAFNNIDAIDTNNEDQMNSIKLD